MAEHIHRRFTDEHVKVLLDLYQQRVVSLEDALQRLGCGRSRFFVLLKRYRQDPPRFTITYPRHRAQHRLPATLDVVIRDELAKDQALIRDPQVALSGYNYAFVRDEVRRHTGQTISVQTVRNRAKAWGYYLYRRKKAKALPREVMTDAVGMLLQHDSSHHKWAPYAARKWTLITTLDDHSRYLLYAELVEQESTWAHIQALQDVVLKHGTGLFYYVDRHSIFRYVCRQESIWRQRRQATEAALTHWQMVIEKCGMRPIYALSAPAKGKVERPYRWLQDRLIRRCARERITDILQARTILQAERQRYNEHQVHSTTQEIPAQRLERALREKRSRFKPFRLRPPYQSLKDIFCLHEYRKLNGYNRLHYDRQTIQVPMPLPAGTTVELHVVPQEQLTEVRVWFDNRIVKVVYY